MYFAWTPIFISENTSKLKCKVFIKIQLEGGGWRLEVHFVVAMNVASLHLINTNNSCCQQSGAHSTAEWEKLCKLSGNSEFRSDFMSDFDINLRKSKKKKINKKIGKVGYKKEFC